MPKIFPTIKKKVVQNVVISGDAVQRNSVRFDLRERLARLRERITIALAANERTRFLTTDAIVLLVKVRDSVSITDSIFISAISSVTSRVSNATSQALAARTLERASYSLTHALVSRLQMSLGFSATPSVAAVSTVADEISMRVPLAIAPRVFDVAAAITSETFEIDGEAYGEAVVTQTGISNANNVLGDTTGTAATAAAASSGVAGTTSNTTNFDLVFELEDADLADLITDISSAVLFFEISGAVGGVSVGGEGTINTFWGFGGTPNNAIGTDTFAVGSALAKASVTVDITAAVADDFTNLNALRLRAQGSVTSGSGIGATSTASFFRGWVEFEGTG